MVNVFKYEEICIGQTTEFIVAIKPEYLDLFCELSGDINPLHRDSEFAKAKGYKDSVVYGMLVASYYSTLAGVYLPGRDCLLHSVETKFVKPVFINDTLTIKGKVTEKNDLFKQITIKAEIINQDNIKVSKAIIKAGVNNE